MLLLHSFYFQIAKNLQRLSLNCIYDKTATSFFLLKQQSYNLFIQGFNYCFLVYNCIYAFVLKPNNLSQFITHFCKIYVQQFEFLSRLQKKLSGRFGGYVVTCACFICHVTEKLIQCMLTIIPVYAARIIAAVGVKNLPPRTMCIVSYNEICSRKKEKQL